MLGEDKVILTLKGFYRNPLSDRVGKFLILVQRESTTSSVDMWIKNDFRIYIFFLAWNQIILIWGLEHPLPFLQAVNTF